MKKLQGAWELFFVLWQWWSHIDLDPNFWFGFWPRWNWVVRNRGNIFWRLFKIPFKEMSPLYLLYALYTTQHCVFATFIWKWKEEIILKYISCDPNIVIVTLHVLQYNNIYTHNCEQIFFCSIRKFETFWVCVFWSKNWAKKVSPLRMPPLSGAGGI